MRFSRGMGAMSPQKLKSVKRRQDGGKQSFAKLNTGGSIKSKSSVNKAGNYTKPSLRKKLFNEIKASATHGTAAGQWSARKAQLLAQRYKKSGGGYKD